MPIYSYICDDCNEDLQLFHGVDETAICSKCNSTNLKKQFRGTKINISTSKITAKDRVEKFIEESREILKEQLIETRKEYKP